MYLSEKSRPLDFYKQASPASAPAPIAAERDLIIEVAGNGTLPPHHHLQMVLGENSSGGEDPEVKAAPKKRAEVWVQEETRSLISFRGEVDGLFNTSKSNKHLWDQISSKLRAKGFDRSPTMCTDKWRNLLKEFKKARHRRDRCRADGSAKVSYYTELDDLLRDRPKNAPAASTYQSPSPSKAETYIQFSDKGLEDAASISFGSLKAGERPTANLERQSNHDGDSLAITSADAIAINEVPPWNWRETPGNGVDDHCHGGKVISVKFGEYTRRIGIDGTADAIKEAIMSAFRLRTKRAFWLEDEDQVVRSLDRDMPPGSYILHIDEGIAIKLCHYDDTDCIRTEEKTLYTEVGFRDFLTRRGFSGLREFSGYRTIDNLDDLESGPMYHGVRLLGD